MLQDPFRQDSRTATPEDLEALVEQGPVSRGLGMALVAEEAQVTDRTLGFLQSDSERRFDAHMGAVFGPEYGNELTAEEANARFGVEGYLSFGEPVNAHRAAEMYRQATQRRYREQTAARADLSPLETLGASLVGSATDPVMLPTWFIGGGSATLRALRVAPGATRTARAFRGAAVGTIDGLTSGAAAEGVNFGARRSTGEDYDGGDALRNILFGGALGAGVGGATGGATRGPGRPRGAIPDLIAREAEARGEDAATAIRIAQLESSLNPRARNPRSSAGGLFQFIDSTWSEFGGGDRMDPHLNARNGVRLLAQNREGLAGALGRQPAGWELYLAHQQGLGGAQELLRDPSRPAVDALRAAGVRNPARALELNGGRADMTAGEFAGLWRQKFGDAGPTIEAMTPRVPEVTRGLTDNERVGAFAEALEAAADDAPLDLAPLLAREGLAALDEASAVPTIRGRWLEADVAVTRTGAEIPVRFAVVELEDLVASHGDDFTPEAGYPAVLQPRDRGRAGAQAENYGLERDLNPALLMRDTSAAGGAPIVSPGGLVEGGNGRVIALRRSARTGTAAWTRYRAHLDAQGLDLGGFERPVLVRMRTEPMSGAARARMAQDLNRSPTEAFSPVEQARTDARRLDADTLGLLDGDDPFDAANRPFLRGFVQRVAPGDANALTDARGALSLAGRARVQAALVQKAYGDDTLTAALFETTDANIRAIGQALADAAPAWARMRAEAPRAMDITPNLTAAVALIREARATRQGVGDLLALRLGQTELFGGEAVSPETEAMIRLMFRDEALTKPRGGERIASALKDYARAAADTPDGPDLFGDTPDGRTVLDTLSQRYARAEGEGRAGLAYAGGGEPAWTSREAEAAVLDLRPAEPVGEGGGGGGERPQDGGRPAGPVGEAFEAEPAVQERLKTAIAAAADPEAKTAAALDRVSPAVIEAAAEAGMDLAGFRHAIAPDDIRHIRKNHGDPKKEAARGQLPITDADLVRLPEVLANPDKVIVGLRGGGADRALPRLALMKRLEDGTTLVLEEVRAGRQRLAVKSMWRFPAAVDDRGMIRALGPNVQNDARGALKIVEVRPEVKAEPEASLGRAARLIASEPELKALMADTEALARAAGQEVPGFDTSREPETLAEAIRAAAFCLTTNSDA